MAETGWHFGEIRRALGDAVAAERFIATVHRRGYRFVAELAAAAPRAQSELDADP